MKILFVINSLKNYGGVEKVTIVKANAFAEIQGNTVAIACTDKAAFPKTMIHPLSPKILTFEIGADFTDLSSNYIRNVLCILPLKLLKLRNSLIEIVKLFNPDVVISVGTWEKYSLATISLAKILHRKSIKIREYHFTSHKKLFDSKKISLAQRVSIAFENKVLSKFFDKNYLLTKEDLLTNFRNNKKFDYQWNPCTFTSINSPKEFSQRKNIVVMVCRLEYQKNVDAMLRIWSKSYKQIPGWKLQIIGDGSCKKQLEELTEKLGIVNTVDFLGYRDNIPEMLQNCKIMAATSRYEGMPLNIIEAMMAGTVPISFKTPYGPSDIIEDGVSGILVDYLNEDQFAAKIVNAIKTSQLSVMSKNSYERAQLFQLSRIVKEWLMKYGQLLSSK